MHGEFPAPRILEELLVDNLVPAILFRTSRKQCDNDIERLQSSRRAVLSAGDSSAIKREVYSVIAKYGFEEAVVTGHQHYEGLLKTGVGAHHAGQLLIWRLLLEELMSRGVLRMMIATGTVAAGVDFPARTVVITAHSKRGSEGFNVLTASEFQQMAGRAGRRGKDAVGICLVAPSRFSDARIIHEVAKRPPEPLRSAYFAAPSTVLNLLKFRNVDDLKFTVSRSLAAFLDRKAAKALRDEVAAQQQELIADAELKGERRKKAEKRLRRKEREADFLEQRQELLLEEALNGLQLLGYLEEGSLSRKGYWAAELCTSLVLELAEAIEAGLLDELSPFELAAMVGSIAGDAHRPYFDLAANPIATDEYRKFEGIVEKVRRTYTRTYISEVAVLPAAGLTVLTWMQSEGWEGFSGLLRLAGVAEGDVARLVTQTADHLNQISKLRESHPELARAAYEARKLLLRPPLSEAYVSD